MEGYPSLVKGTVSKTVRPFAARGFEPHTFLLIDNLFYLFHTNVKQSCSLNTCGLKSYSITKGDNNDYSKQSSHRKMDQRTA